MFENRKNPLRLLEFQEGNAIATFLDLHTLVASFTAPLTASPSHFHTIPSFPPSFPNWRCLEPLCSCGLFTISLVCMASLRVCESSH